MDYTLPQDRDQVLPEYYKDKDQLQRAHDFLMEKLESVEEDHRNRSRKWEEWDKAYNLVDEQRPDEGCGVVDPEIQVIVDTLVSNEVEAFLGQDPAFKLSPMEEEDEEQAELMTFYIADGHRRIQLREKFERAIRQKRIFGTAIVKTPYVLQVTERKVRRVIEETLPDGRKKKKTKIETVKFPTFDDTDFEPVSIFDFYPIGSGTTIEELEGCVQIFKRKFDKLQEKEYKEKDNEISGVYCNLDSVRPVQDDELTLAEYWGEIPKSVITGKDEDRLEKFEGVITAVINFSENSDSRRIVKANRSPRTGELSYDKNEKEQPRVGAIRLQENPFWNLRRPFLACPNKPVENEFYGRGEIESLIEKAQELNTTIRQIADIKTLQLLNPTIEDVTAKVQRNIKLIKNPRIKANDINGIRTFPINDFSGNGYAYIRQIKDDMRRASAATDGVQGVPVKGEQSATEFAAIQQQAGVRLKGTIKLTDERLFKPFIERCYENAMQFATVEKMVKVNGAKGARFQAVKPEDVYGSFNIITKGPTEIENSTIMSNKLIQYLSIAARAPQAANIPFLLQEIWVKMGMPESEKHKVVLAGANETEEDIQMEIEAMSFGQPIKAKPNQNHQLHIQLKVEAFKQIMDNGLDTPENTKAFQQNVDEHAQLMATQNSQSQVIGAQGGFPTQDVGGQEAPNPMDQSYGPSPSGSGSRAV